MERNQRKKKKKKNTDKKGMKSSEYYTYPLSSWYQSHSHDTLFPNHPSLQQQALRTTIYTPTPTKPMPIKKRHITTITITKSHKVPNMKKKKKKITNPNREKKQTNQPTKIKDETRIRTFIP
jgi:hypothetical protein